MFLGRLNCGETTATITITDKFSDRVDYDNSTYSGEYVKETHTVTWTFEGYNAVNTLN